MRLAALLIVMTAMVFCGACQRKAGTSVPAAPADSSVVGEYTLPQEYTELSPEIIAKLPDDEVEWAVVSYVFSKMGEDYSRERRIVTALSKGMQMVYSTWILEGEVFNGGFHQYFFNTEGEFALEAVAGYRLIAAEQHAALVAKAIELAAKEKVLRADLRASRDLQQFADSYKETKLASLDDVFYSLEKTEDAARLRVKYIRDHPDQFVGD